MGQTTIWFYLFLRLITSGHVLCKDPKKTQDPILAGSKIRDLVRFCVLYFHFPRVPKDVGSCHSRIIAGSYESNIHMIEQDPVDIGLCALCNFVIGSGRS